MTDRIKFRRDRLFGIDWAHLPKSIFSLAMFAPAGDVYLVANAQDAPPAQSSFKRIRNPKYARAESFADFKRVAEAFQADSTD